jgi:hypothetical protein
VNPHRVTPDVFGARGVVPIGYAAFAFALGVAAGALVRRTVPAMAATLAIVATAQAAMPVWIRAHLIAPVRATVPLDTSQLRQLDITGGHVLAVGTVHKPGAWILSNQTVTSSGAPFVAPADPAACNRNTSPKACMDWLAAQHPWQTFTYQPDSRFWPLQWYELSLFLGLAVLLGGFCFWWVRRRLR